MGHSMKFIHLYSGGLDSTVLLYDLLDQGAHVHCLLFNYGQKHLRELDCAEHICHHLGVNYDRFALAPKIFHRSTLTNREGQLVGRDTVVPNRNMCMISMAASYALSYGATAVTWAANADDGEVYPDCRYEFFKAINEALRIADIRRMEVHAPYIQRTKKQIVEIGVKLGVPFESTWSCYTEKAVPCGKCGACLQREAALAGVPKKSKHFVGVR
jgi:7-cyano-7-deazaguanine synthase